MPALAFGILGLIIGSFINVVVLRAGARSVSGRSGCMSCGVHIRWFDLIPVLSWFLLRGRCRACGSRISPQYPAVELSTGISFALIGGAPLSPMATVLGLLICAVLVAIAVYDLRHTVIPDAWVWSFNALAFSSIFLSPLYPIPSTLWPILAGPAVASPLFALWLVSRGKWMGLGDPKLALGIGWLLGPLYGIQAVLLAFIIGAIFSVCVLLPLPYIVRFLRKAARLRLACSGQGIAHADTPISYTIGNAGISYSRRSLGNESAEALSFHAPRWTMKSEIPFGPFLIAACLFQWFSLMYSISIPFLWHL